MKDVLSPEDEIAILQNVKSDLVDHFENLSFNKTGHEHFHPDIGEYWKPPNITVCGDMTDFENLKILSSVMDKHGVCVHQKYNVSFSEASEDGYARMVVDRT